MSAELPSPGLDGRVWWVTRAGKHNDRVGRSIDPPFAKSLSCLTRGSPPLGTIPISFQFIIKDLGKVGHSWILWWERGREVATYCPARRSTQRIGEGS